MSTWGGGGWGTWHTSSAIDAPCPQGCGRHTVDEAVELNDAERVRAHEGLRIAHERWLHDGDVPDRSVYHLRIVDERVHVREGDAQAGFVDGWRAAVGRRSSGGAGSSKGYL